MLIRHASLLFAPLVFATACGTSRTGSDPVP
jgi:hypothetical protein